MLKTINHLDLSDDSRVWIFQSAVPFNGDQLKSELETFGSSWMSHGCAVESHFEIIEERILIVVVNESIKKISGCGIDKLIHFLQQINSKSGANLLDRSGLYIKAGDKLVFQKIADLEDLFLTDSDFLNGEFLDSSILNFRDLRNGIFNPIRGSWIEKRFSRSKNEKI